MKEGRRRVARGEETGSYRRRCDSMVAGQGSGAAEVEWLMLLRTAGG
jgi:hypothetical protein